MEAKSIVLPAIRDDLAGDRFLIRIAADFVSAPHDLYYLDFQKCSVLSQNALAVLGGICNYSQCRMIPTANIGHLRN
ncbi:hypothetical protein [Cellvibrio sp. OA-2007]|uniref:hypothetical protein n=1 Tax=Cellvibrio sp. OA-2007 TaxID=529823 RepID=UPI000A756C07|nr:hypothetical protein [Cellvibrio sp. OA-2007]